MESRTYGVYGMLEWSALISNSPHGRVWRIPFKGGSSSGFGDAPATFTTGNPVIMKVIEDSRYYHDKKIVRLR